MEQKKPICSLSLDLDNQWSYMKIHGDSGWEQYPSYLDIFIPHLLDLLDHLDLKITVFVVGQDASLPPNHDVLKSMVDKGHEVGNHSFHHESWLHLYSRDQIHHEIMKAEEEILKVTGQKPIGFRGPGFSWSRDLLSVLFENGYLYDASTLPTYIGPLARMYYFSKADLSKEEKQDRRELFGKFQDGLKPVKSYYWVLDGDKKLLEIPVTTMPWCKIPFHLSYLIYLSRISTGLMQVYLSTALRLCRLTRTEPSFLLHPLDLIGGDKVPALSFFPGMDVTSAEKMEIFCMVIERIRREFEMVSLNTYARSSRPNRLRPLRNELKPGTNEKGEMEIVAAEARRHFLDTPERSTVMRDDLSIVGQAPNHGRG